MCGIVGILEFERRGETPHALLRRMADAISHRGPDEDGYWISDGIGLAARRLRINDLVTGQQPIANEDGSLHLVANGEIYNSAELRTELRRRGHVFTTWTDIEVILHAYEENGVECLDRLEGMFAFAIWDARARRLVVARDRFGEKPLYYARLPHAFVFASELKALLLHPGLPRDLDWAALAKFLALEYVPSPHAIFRAVRKMRSAHWMAVSADGGETSGRYWQPPRPSPGRPGQQEAAEHVLALLRASVRDRIVCDVPWGTFLSGGLDSSLITALAVGESPRPVNTFALGFEERSYDERRYATEVATTLGTEHHEVVLRPGQAREMLPDVARIFDEPIADATIIPAVLVSRLARTKVTMVLSGDGGDELFCGYPTQTAHLAAELFRRFPSGLRNVIAGAAKQLRTSDRYLSFDFALRRFVRDAARPAPERHLRWMGSFSPETLPRVFSEEARQQVEGIDPYDDARQALGMLRPRSSSDVATTLDLLFYLAEDNLVQADRASMSTALEVRAPFLDRQLAEYALRLPAEVRQGIWRTKPVLRRAARPMLARHVCDRGKHGFGVPTSAWLRGELRNLVTELLSPARLSQQGMFSPSYVGLLVKQHLSGTANHRKELWTLLMFQLWASQYLGA